MNITKVNSPMVIAGCMEASGSYLRGNLNQAVTVARNNFATALEMGIEDPYLLWASISLWAVNSAKVGIENEAHDVMKKADLLLNSSYLNANISRMTLETDARIDGILGLDQFLKKQEMARNNVFDKEGVVQDRYTAMLINRNELEAMNKMGDTNIDQIEKLVNDSKLISGNDYRRILDEIIGLASKLDSKRERGLKKKGELSYNKHRFAGVGSQEITSASSGLL